MNILLPSLGALKFKLSSWSGILLETNPGEDIGGCLSYVFRDPQTGVLDFSSNRFNAKAMK